MCGILGAIHSTGESVKPEVLKRLNCAINHRGPDEEGYFFHDNYGCAISRLSIIDLEGGSQPIYRRNNELVIVYNGELYNYRAIRETLVKKGHVFKTASDTEVVLAAYEEWKEGCLEYFNGMFAIAIYDKVKRELFLARDRLGIKQLYYYQDNGLFVFASEMKTLFNYPGVQRRLNLPVLSQYLDYGYYACGGETPVANIHLIKPGHFMKVSANGKIEVRSYWEIPPGVSHHYRSEREAAENIYSLLVDAVRRRLVADVKICVMLSSGLDSSTLSYILHRELKTPMKAFTVGLDSPEFDESKDASQLASSFDMEWERTVIHPEDIRRDFNKIIYHTDSLQGNPAQIIYYYCNKLIHERGYKVTLNGSGGDELFLGYPTYQADTVFRYYRLMPAFLKKAFHRLALCLPAGMGRVSLNYKVKKFTEFIEKDAFKAHAYWRTILTIPEQKRLFKREFHESLGDWYSLYKDSFDNSPDMPFLNKLQLADLYSWLIPLLAWVDNMSMAHSVELRVPFLDHKLVEEVVRLPPEYKFRGWELKRLMKTFLRDKLPEKSLRISKRGTHVPLGTWLNNELSSIKQEYLSPERIHRLGLFETKEIERLVHEHSSMKKDNTFKLWNLIVFSAWAEQFDISI